MLTVFFQTEEKFKMVKQKRLNKGNHAMATG